MKFETNLTKIKGGCQSGRKGVTHNSKSDLSLVKFICVCVCFTDAILARNILLGKVVKTK